MRTHLRKVDSESGRLDEPTVNMSHPTLIETRIDRRPGTIASAVLSKEHILHGLERLDRELGSQGARAELYLVGGR
jgi:hypothetical protein